MTGSTPTTRHILTLACPDRPGIVHAVSAGLLDVDGNIVENAQFSEPDTGIFCLRTVVDAPTADSADVRAAVIARLAAAGIVDAPPTHIGVRPADHRPSVMIMVSKADHCLVDLLYRWRTGALPIDIPVIVSNHTDLAEHAERHGIEFRHLPVTPDTKAAQEQALRDVIAEFGIDLVVLARYMQILSDALCRELAGRAINIHHSFLPGFKGARPYHQAHQRGVKIVGATAHFITSDLDEGPIIEQDVTRVTHAHTPEELTRMGQDTERLVLARAVRLWSEDRIVRVGAKTVVFD
jgi:formyltetrahydrofolate deformylase